MLPQELSLYNEAETMKNKQEEIREDFVMLIISKAFEYLRFHFHRHSVTKACM